MRVVIIGASPLGVNCAETLVKRKVDVVLIDRNKERIESLGDTLDAGFLHGDGTKPAILRETGPEEHTVLLCLTNNDQDNILAALVGRSLGFGRVIPKLENAEFQHICLELGLSDTIIPDRTIGTALADLVQGRQTADWSAVVTGDMRLFRFAVPRDAVGPLSALRFPGDTRPICVYRNDDAIIVTEKTELAPGDELVLITRAGRLDELRERWNTVSGAG